MVGAVRFELTTSCTRNKRATRLRYAPTQGQEKVPTVRANCNGIPATFPRVSNTEGEQLSLTHTHTLTHTRILKIHRPRRVRV